MKKYLKHFFILILFTLLIVPQVTFAVWWNPFSWFRKKLVTPAVGEVSTVITKKLPIPDTKSPEKKDFTNKKTSKPTDSQSKNTEEENKTNQPSQMVLSGPKTANVTLSISNINVDNKVYSAYVSWHTNIATESKFLLNGNAYQSKNGVDALHYVEIGELMAGQSYTGTITALANNAWVSKEITFSTKQAPPKVVTVPVVLATVKFYSFTTPAQGVVFIDNGSGKDNLLMWQNVLTIETKSAILQSIKFRQIGSVSPSSFEDFQLYVGDNIVSSATSVNADGYVIFNFSPTSLDVGAYNIKMTGDIKPNYSKDRTMVWSLRSYGDINIVDAETNNKISPSGTPFTAGSQELKMSTGTNQGLPGQAQP